MYMPLLLLLLTSSLFRQATSPPPADHRDVLTISGATDPGQIPEWLAWEYSFTLLHAWQGKDSGFTHDLRDSLTIGEFQLLEHEASEHKARAARRAALGTKLMERYPYATTKDPQVIAQANDEGYAIDLEYRRQILASRDRLLDAFRTESQVALLDWVAENKAAITSTVHKSNLKRWRSPE